MRTTYGSVLFADHVPDQDALVVQRMAQAGAISLGKTNTPEFGAGSHTVNPVFGATRNPYDLSRSAGGSSGGAAAALAARMISLADGSDLGGSLRNPAGFCNVVGLRPSPGRVPTWPVTDVADALGVEGPMGRTVADVALLLSVLSGPDPRVPLALDAPAPRVQPGQIAGLLARDLQGVRVAWSPRSRPAGGAGGAGRAGPARQVLAGLGCEMIDADPDLSGADEVFRTRRAFRFATAFGPLLRKHPGRLGPNVTWNIERGLELSVADLSRATELHAALAGRVSEFFESVEVLACPVTQVVPFDVTLDWVHDIDGEPQRTYLDWMASAYLISVTGLPAISVRPGSPRTACRWGSSWSAAAGRTGRCCRWRTRSRLPPGTARSSRRCCAKGFTRPAGTFHRGRRNSVTASQPAAAARGSSTQDRLGDRHRVIEAGRRGAHVEPGVGEQQRTAGRGRQAGAGVVTGQQRSGGQRGQRLGAVQAGPGQRPVLGLGGAGQGRAEHHAPGDQEAAHRQGG